MATYTTHVVVFGGTMASIMAAVAAAQAGATVSLVHAYGFVGGMTRHGLSGMDYGPTAIKTQLLGGLTRSRFFDALDAYYSQPAGTLVMNPEPKAVSAALTSGGTALLNTPGLTVYNNAPLVSVAKSGSRIVSINAGSHTFIGNQFVDGSYEGDLAAMAGVTCRHAREGMLTYGEPGEPPSIPGARSREQNQPISVLDSNGQRIYATNPMPRQDIAPGDPILSTMAFNFRVVLTNTPALMRARVAPAGYNAADYEILLRFLSNSVGEGITKLVGTTSSSDAILGGVQLRARASDPNVKFDCNRLTIVTSNFYQSGYGRPTMQSAWIEADNATRLAIKTDHYRWIAGLIYFIQTDAALGALRPALQADALTYGYPSDEFSANYFGQPGFPFDLYVREGRRIIGQYVMRQHDVMDGARQPDPIARFGYSMDTHGALRYPRPGTPTHWQNEGGFNIHIEEDHGGWYDIPMRALLPAKGQADNLTVPWCVSASRIAFSSLRMEIAGMLMGEAAGVMANLARTSGTDPVDLRYPQVRSAMLANGSLI